MRSSSKPLYKPKKPENKQNGLRMSSPFMAAREAVSGSTSETSAKGQVNLPFANAIDPIHTKMPENVAIKMP